MIKKIIQAIKPNYFLDYIFIFILFWNFFPLIILTFFSLVGIEDKIIQTLYTLTTFHYWFLIPRDAELGAIGYFIYIPVVIAILINLLALILKGVTGKIKYSSIIGTTLIFALLSLLVIQADITIGSIKYNNLRKERETIGKEMIINLEKCDFIQESDDTKQLECKFTLSNTPSISDEEPYIEIIIRNDRQPVEVQPVANLSFKLAKTKNNIFEGNFIITKPSGEEFSSFYISSFDLIDDFERYPSKDLKLYLIR